MRFRLRSLLIAVALLALILNWFVQRAKTQQAAVARIVELGGAVRYDSEIGDDGHLQPRRHVRLAWLYRLLGEDYFDTVVYIQFIGGDLSDDDLAVFADLPNLKSVYLEHCGISDAGLVHFRNLRELKELLFRRTHVTSAGVSALREAIPQCEIGCDEDWFAS